jgi:hypothetical protein
MRGGTEWEINRINRQMWRRRTGPAGRRLRLGPGRVAPLERREQKDDRQQAENGAGDRQRRQHAAVGRDEVPVGDRALDDELAAQPVREQRDPQGGEPGADADVGPVLAAAQLRGDAARADPDSDRGQRRSPPGEIRPLRGQARAP